VIALAWKDKRTPSASPQMGHTVCIVLTLYTAVVFKIASAVAEANQCLSVSGCPSDDMPKSATSLLQTKLHVNALEQNAADQLWGPQTQKYIQDLESLERSPSFLLVDGAIPSASIAGSTFQTASPMNATQHVNRYPQLPAPYFWFSGHVAEILPGITNSLLQNATLVLQPPSSEPQELATPNKDSYSQFGQDKILRPILSKVSKGFFCRKRSEGWRGRQQLFVVRTPGWLDWALD